MKLNLIKLNIPLNYNLFIIKKFKLFYIIIQDDQNYLKLIFKKKEYIKINKSLNYIEYKNNILKKNLYVIKNNFINFLKKTHNYYFLKIKFKGKGYKIGFYKKKKINNFFFGKSHKSIFIYNNIKIKKLTKYKFIIISNNINKLKKLGVNILKIKKLNDYTNRGLRLSKQIILKRKGKKGSFI